MIVNTQQGVLLAGSVAGVAAVLVVAEGMPRDRERLLQLFGVVVFGKLDGKSLLIGLGGRQWKLHRVGQ